jgi:hypothetical protein
VSTSVNAVKGAAGADTSLLELARRCHWGRTPSTPSHRHRPLRSARAVSAPNTLATNHPASHLLDLGRCSILDHPEILPYRPSAAVVKPIRRVIR